MGKKKKISTKEEKSANLDRWITPAVTALTLLAGIYQFTANQRIEDKRKYSYIYYEERYRVFKSLSKSIAEVHTTMIYGPTSVAMPGIENAETIPGSSGSSTPTRGAGVSPLDLEIIQEELADKRKKDSLATRISNQNILFNYALLVLDKENDSDREIIRNLKTYQDFLHTVYKKNDFAKADTLHLLGKQIIQQCGKVLKDEKDVINSYSIF